MHKLSFIGEGKCVNLRILVSSLAGVIVDSCILP